MKLNGILGSGTGKLGSAVFSSVAGRQIVRQYQPVVSNPNSVAQVNQRARLKLASQIAAALAPVIVIPKNGLVSARNGFISKNFEQFVANEGVAQVTYENLQLTNGNAGLPAIEATRSLATGISLNLADRALHSVSRVAYVLYRKNSEALLQYVDSVVVSAAGPNGDFPGSLPYQSGELVFFAYGMKDLNASATAKYSNYSVANGEDIARLVMTRAISMSDFQFTQTRGTTMLAGENETTQVPEGSARVFVTSSGPGTVAGAGVFEIGEQVTVTATPNVGSLFRGWKINGSSGSYVSTSASYTFTLNGQVDLVAEFYTPGQASEYTIAVATSDPSLGSVSISPSSVIAAGEQVTLSAQIIGNSSFVGWKDQASGSTISSEPIYTFTPSGDMSIQGVFREGGDE